MRQTDDNERREHPAPHKKPGALTPPVPCYELPEPKADASDDEAAKAPKNTTSGFSSFES